LAAITVVLAFVLLAGLAFTPFAAATASSFPLGVGAFPIVALLTFG
jgi:hypothetical protein